MNGLRRNGQISLWVAGLGAAGMIVASVVTSWATANNRIWGVQSKVDVVEEREDNHFRELSDKMDKLDAKIDRLIEKSGKSPASSVPQSSALP